MSLETFLEIGLCIDGIYLLLGFVFAVIFLWKGIQVVDEGTEGTGIGFKTTATPGYVGLLACIFNKVDQNKKSMKLSHRKVHPLLWGISCLDYVNGPYKRNAMSVKYNAVLWNGQKKTYDKLLWLGIALFALSYVVFQLIFHPTITVETVIIRVTALGGLHPFAYYFDDRSSCSLG